MRSLKRAPIFTITVILTLVLGVASVASMFAVGSGLLLRSADRLHDVDPGFDAGDVTTLWTQLPFARYDDAASVAFYARLAERAGQVPGVRSAGLAMRVPLGAGEALEQAFRTDDGARTPTLPLNVLDRGFFRTLGIPPLAGGVAAGFAMHAMVAPFLRAFLHDVTPTDPVALVGATLLLAGTASLASWLPARRAARVDPAEVLRAE